MCWLSSQINLQACFTSVLYYSNWTNFTFRNNIISEEKWISPSIIRISLFPDISFTCCSLHSGSTVPCTLLLGAPGGWYGDQTKKKFIYVIREESGEEKGYRGEERRKKENREYQNALSIAKVIIILWNISYVCDYIYLHA